MLSSVGSPLLKLPIIVTEDRNELALAFGCGDGGAGV